MAIKYTEEQLNSVDKSMLIQMFLNQQEQLEKVSADSFLIIKQIQAIYREEGKLKELSSKERLVQRQVVVKPLVDALFVYLKQHENEVGTEKLRETSVYKGCITTCLTIFLCIFQFHCHIPAPEFFHSARWFRRDNNDSDRHARYRHIFCFH